MYGDVHAANAAASSLHSNVEFGSLDENVYGLAIDVIDVSGATVSTVNVRVAGVMSTLPAASVARTENVCSPSAKVPVAYGDVHGANGARVELALERRARLAGRERERGRA